MVLFVFGGLIVGVIVIGVLYGCEKCVWCKYLCLVNGVFGLFVWFVLMCYKVDEDVWCCLYKNGEYGYCVILINCVLFVLLCNMKGVVVCYMCGCCSGYCDVILLLLCLLFDEVVNFGVE